MRFQEKYKVVPVLNDGDLDAGATLDTDSINMSKYHFATFLINIQDIGVADVTLTAHSGATDGAITSTLYFDYAYGGAAQASANCDVLSASTNANTLVIGNASKDNFLLVVEVDASAMDVANGEEWLTLRFTCGAATGNVCIDAILEPRYTGNLSATALT